MSRRHDHDGTGQYTVANNEHLRERRNMREAAVEGPTCDHTFCTGQGADYVTRRPDGSEEYRCDVHVDPTENNREL